MKSAEETAFDWYIKRIAQLEAELTEAKLQRDSWKRIAESGLGITAEPPVSTLCAICDQIKELHPASHPWTAKETNNVQGTPLGRLAHETGSVPETFAEYDGPLPEGWKVEPKPNGGATSWHRAHWVNGVLKCWECPAEWSPANRSSVK